MVRWQCQVCRSLIDGDTGFAAISYAELEEHERALAEWDARDRGGDPDWIIDAYDLLSYPNPVRWRIRHDHCAGGDEDDTYSIGIGRLRSAADVLRWTAHLAQKGWVEATDWDVVLLDVASSLDRDEGASAGEKVYPAEGRQAAA